MFGELQTFVAVQS